MHNPQLVATNGSYVYWSEYLTSPIGGAVRRVRIGSSTVETIYTGAQIWGLAANATHAYYALRDAIYRLPH